MNTAQIESDIKRWLEDVVIGCGFCPFASQPYLNEQVHIHIDSASSDENVLSSLMTQLKLIEASPSSKIETTLIVLPAFNQGDFYRFNDFLEETETLLDDEGWVGEFQIASFHPQYQFAGTHADDAENLTNRSPYPILHIIREDSLEAVIAHHPNPDAIFEKNIETTKSFSLDKKMQLFPYLFRKQ